MRRSFTKSLIMGAAAMAGLAGAGQVASYKTLAAAPANTVEYKATNERKKTVKQKIAVNDMTGGLDFPTPYHAAMSPKEYGMRYGNGGSKRSNRLRYSHNAKVKRRKEA